MGEAGEGSSLKPEREAQARHSDALGKLEGAAGLVSTIASLRGNDSAKAPLRTLPNNVPKDVVNMVKSMGGRPERTRDTDGTNTLLVWWFRFLGEPWEVTVRHTTIIYPCRAEAQAQSDVFLLSHS